MLRQFNSQLHIYLCQWLVSQEHKGIALSVPFQWSPMSLWTSSLPEPSYWTGSTSMNRCIRRRADHSPSSRLTVRIPLVDHLPPPPSYDAYLDSFVTDKELLYLKDAQMARDVIELGYLRGAQDAARLVVHAAAGPLQLASHVPASLICEGEGQLLRRSEFEGRKAALEAHRAALAMANPPLLLGARLAPLASPLLVALAQRESAVRKGTLATIVYLRTRNAAGQARAD